ncbi:MAG: class A beta-lactamase [Alphaproteobacteria bacterium]|nr:MAG: class A beta-lactamase [Alphaproteobacteria bacterium]PZO40901.1 MAG: class A beta-lactamase [Alphaproteobacteria bacterium]
MDSLDRRSILTGFGALGLGLSGCARQTEPARSAQTSAGPGTLDLAALEARHGGRLGFAVRDTATGQALVWRGDDRFVYCSTFKMYLAAATLMRVQEGQERLDRAIPVTAADMINHAPVTGAAVGGTMTIEALMKGTVEVSDNPAANILIRELGGLAEMQAFYRSLGDMRTRVDRLEPEMNRLDGDKDTITPAQSALNIETLFVAPNSPLVQSSRQRLLGWMLASPTGPERIKAGVPAGWRVAHKTGTGGYGPTNDIGLIYPPSAPPVVVAAYFHATETSTEAQRDAVIADATRMALTAIGLTA